MAYKHRDFDKQPYSSDEFRVVQFFRELTHDLGGGDDPIGFLLGSYRMLRAQLDEAHAKNRELRGVLESIHRPGEYRYKEDSGC